MKYLASSVSYKEIFKIAYPILLGNLAQTLITFTDTAFMGHVGTVELGAAMLAGIYYYVFSTLAWGFAVGTQIIIARRLGEGNFHEIGKTFDHGLCFVSALAIILFCILHFSTAGLLQSFIHSDQIYASAMDFMHYRQFGILFVCFNFLFRSLYIGLSQTKIITFTTLLMAVVNILLDYLLIFGKWGFPSYGIGGAAIASVAAEISAFLFFIIYTCVKLPVKKYGLFKFEKFSSAIVKSVSKLSFPSMLQRLISFGSWFLFFIFVEQMGEISIAVTGIVRSVYMLLLIPVFAFSATINTLTSRLIGAQKSGEVPATIIKGMKLSLLCVIPLILVCLIIPEQLASIYTDDGNLAHSAVSIIYLICLSTVVSVFSAILFDAVSGTGNTIAALLLESAVLILYITHIILCVNVLHTSLEWVWGAEIIYAVGLAVVSLLYLKYSKWQKNRI